MKKQCNCFLRLKLKTQFDKIIHFYSHVYVIARLLFILHFCNLF